MSDAADKLARTRMAIIDHVQRRDRQGGREEKRAARDRAQGRDEEGEPQRSSGSGPSEWFGHVKSAIGSWWRHHPAHLGLELATPVLSAYAARKPAQFLGIAAVVGAVVMVARPWRLISATGLLVALVKSSQLSSLVMSALSAADYQKDSQPPT